MEGHEFWQLWVTIHKQFVSKGHGVEWGESMDICMMSAGRYSQAQPQQIG
jgi:hypothetical protein